MNTNSFQSTFALPEPFLFEDSDLKTIIGIMARGSYTAMLRDPSRITSTDIVSCLDDLAVAAVNGCLAAFSGKMPVSALSASALSAGLGLRVNALFSEEGYMGSATLEEIGIADAYLPVYEEAKATLEAKRAAAEFSFDFSLPEGVPFRDAASGQEVCIGANGSGKVTLRDPDVPAGGDGIEKARAAAIAGAKEFLNGLSGNRTASELSGEEMQPVWMLALMSRLFQAGFQPLSIGITFFPFTPVQSTAPAQNAAPEPKVPPVQPKIAVMKFCPNCGRKNVNLGKFCEDCGTPLTGRR